MFKFFVKNSLKTLDYEDAKGKQELRQKILQNTLIYVKIRNNIMIVGLQQPTIGITKNSDGMGRKNLQGEGQFDLLVLIVSQHILVLNGNFGYQLRDACGNAGQWGFVVENVQTPRMVQWLLQVVFREQC
eukprot:TRINITY_DN6073_c7_g1_i1.p2 TRINITY_DN6073_c7_g1~~TRINITY_DN6073_c7_g1_i1.p2  ORF type:complete len:130 (-),score=11.87 TRINITY_DN6073_c7_g1_i1:36-425(-)